MGLINPAEEQHREQQSMHVEALRDERNELIRRLGEILGTKDFGVASDGSVSYKLSGLETSMSQEGELAEAEKRLKEIYAEAKKLGIKF